MNLNQITLPVLDIEKSIPFYQTLGFKLIVKSLPDYARFLCDQGEATFSIHRVNALTTGDGIWIYFELDNLDVRVAELQVVNITFEELPTDKPWLWREARLKDPDGNQLILYSAGENRINPPWRV
ncbi:VOC family protein [uncultured Cytophaga sp.]|uniref:VOC family protein n=1 Tax=uncultured Cytophaga sp. TaxID=160238 RepID=UPI00261E6971|nr:VOC family protein [uncultured Cytophaga sp.]